VIVDCAIYREGHRSEGPEDLSDALDEARSAGGFVWIGLHEPTEKEFGLVTREFGLHPLAVEDALKAHQRPKLEVYDDSLFVVLKPVVYEPESDTVSTGEVMLFLGDAFVVTVRHGVGSPLKAVRERLEQEPQLLGKGPTSVLYAVADAVVDHYLEVTWRSWRRRSSRRTAAAHGTPRPGSTPSSGRSWSSAAPPSRSRCP
jgi:magnesium transporter